MFRCECQCMSGMPHHPHLGCPIVHRWYTQPGFGDVAVVGCRWIKRVISGMTITQGTVTCWFPVEADGSIIRTPLEQVTNKDMPPIAMQCITEFALAAHKERMKQLEGR